MTATSSPVIIAPGPELMAFLKAAMRELREEEAQAEIDAAQCMSSIAVARLARRRTELVGEALKSGALSATRYGSNPDHPRYAIRKADAVAWIEAGCPAVLPSGKAAG